MRRCPLYGTLLPGTPPIFNIISDCGMCPGNCFRSSSYTSPPRLLTYRDAVTYPTTTIRRKRWCTLSQLTQPSKLTFFTVTGSAENHNRRHMHRKHKGGSNASTSFTAPENNGQVSVITLRMHIYVHEYNSSGRDTGERFSRRSRSCSEGTLFIHQSSKDVSMATPRCTQ